MQVAGIDVGAGAAKAVILRDGEVVSYSIMPVTSSVVKVGEEVMKKALENNE